MPVLRNPAMWAGPSLAPLGLDPVPRQEPQRRPRIFQDAIIAPVRMCVRSPVRKKRHDNYRRPNGHDDNDARRWRWRRAWAGLGARWRRAGWAARARRRKRLHGRLAFVDPDVDLDLWLLWLLRCLLSRAANRQVQ